MSNPPTTYPDLERLRVAVVTAAMLEPGELASDRRHPKIVRARRAFVVLAREMTTRSFPQIVRYVSPSGSHSSAITNHKDALKLLAAEPPTAEGEALAKLIEAARGGVRA